MRRLIVTSLLAATLVGCGGQQARNVDVSVKEVITEDDPRWDCRTMGNHICGDTPTRVDHWQS